MYEDDRCVLAKLIYGMTKNQQEEFRCRFPTPILDEYFYDAIKFARVIVEKK